MVENEASDIGFVTKIIMRLQYIDTTKQNYQISPNQPADEIVCEENSCLISFVSLCACLFLFMFSFLYICFPVCLSICVFFVWQEECTVINVLFMVELSQDG